MSASITRQRLANQQVARPRFTSVAALVEWMGAVQAQDFRGSLWAVGLRLAAAVEAEVEQDVVAYKDRDAAVDHPAAREDRLKTVGTALIVVDGTVRGSWRRTLSATAVTVTLQFWTAPTAPERRAVEKAVARYAGFLGLKAEIAGISR